MQEDANRKRHSTVSQALAVGRSMGAGVTLLTHFSGRYPKVPIITDDMCSKDVAIAHDNMRIAFSQLGKLHHLAKVLRDVFAEEQVEMTDRTAKKEVQKAMEEELLREQELLLQKSSTVASV